MSEKLLTIEGCPCDCCGDCLPCICCKKPTELRFVDCETLDITVCKPVAYGPECKLDRQSQDNCAVLELEAYAIWKPEFGELPPLGAKALVNLAESGDPEWWRLTGVMTESCNVCFELRRPMVPCFKTVQLIQRPQASSRCEPGPPTVVGDIEVALFNSGLQQDTTNEIRQLQVMSSAYFRLPVGLLPFDLRCDMVFECDGVWYRIDGAKNFNNIEGCPYYELVETEACFESAIQEI